MKLPGSELHKAAFYGDVPHAVQCLQNGSIPVDSFDDDGDTPLILATIRGHLEFAIVLLHGGANVNARSARGLTPLGAATEKNQPEHAREFIAAGADVEAQCCEQTCLLMATAKGFTGVVRELIRGGAKLDWKCSHSGYPAVALAAFAGHVDIVRQLVDAGANLGIAGSGGNTALHIASVKGNVESMRILLAGGADVNLTTEDGSTALLCACENGQEEAVEGLLKARPDIHATGRLGHTAVVIVSTIGHVGILRRLLRAGASPSVCIQPHRWTPLHFAAHHGHGSIIAELVKEFDAPACGSSSKTSTEPVQNLQDALNARCHGGRTALHVAADSAQLGPARVLLAAGALETTMGFLRTPPSATIGYALNPQNPVRERALWRLLQQAPAYRFISWLWPAVPIDSGGGFGEGGKTKTLTSESCCLRDNLGNWQIYRKLKLGPKLDVTPIMSRYANKI